MHDLFFAPELSPSNRATIGGMIATDASGQGSVLYGKTRDHVLELNAVFIDGTPFHSRPLSALELATAKARTDRVGHVLRVLDRIREDDAELIAERFPKLNRCVTGYDLVHLCDCHGRFDLSAVLCGAEGTLAFVTEAKVRLTRGAAVHCVCSTFAMATFDAALRDAGTLMKLQAASSETIDAHGAGPGAPGPVWLKVRDYFPDDPEGPAEGVNIVEFVADEQAALEQQLARVEAALAEGGAGRRGYTVARGAEAADGHLVDAQEVGRPARQHAGRAPADAVRRGHGRATGDTWPTTSASSGRCWTAAGWCTACSATSMPAACTSARRWT